MNKLSLQKIKTSDLIAVQLRVDAILLRLSSLDYSNIGEALYHEIMLEIEVLFTWARHHLKQKPEHPLIREVYYKTVSAKLGGKVPYFVLLNPTYASLTQFIEINALHHKFQTLKIQIEVDSDNTPLIAIDTENRGKLPIPWNAMTIIPISGKFGKTVGYTFYYFDELLFKTDHLYKLIDDYILTYKGITQCHPHENEELIAYDKRDPKEWGESYVVEIWTMLKNSSGEKPTMGIGDHCHILLKDPKGYVYSMGKFGAGKKFSAKDYLTLFGPKSGRFISPDFFSYYSQASRNLKRVQIKVSEEEFNRLYKMLSDDKKEKDPVFTVLKQNCAHYVQKMLKKALNIQVDSELFLLTYVLRAFFPGKVQKAIFKCTKDVLEKCPKWLQKACYFFPPVYIPMVIGCLIIRVMSISSHVRVKRSDYHLKDIFLYPWNLTIYHPIALRESLDKLYAPIT
ncbi:MAG: hypothetical protein K9M07_06605 [Simkaniaceae bacterium]|nr:hypothetical protein [Simkaniaceae bacterium]